MRFNDNTRAQILVNDVQTNVDPATGTLALAIDGTEYPCIWDGSANHDVTAGTWTRQAHTTAYFAGPAVPIGQINGATPLALGIHTAELRVTIGGTIIAQHLEDFRVQ